MNSFNTPGRWLRSLGQRRAVKQEIDEELRFHLEQRTVENIAAGMSPEEAAREARKRFGNFQSVREECRDARGASFGEATWMDLKFALRQLLKNPGFTAVAVLTLALGIGANTAVFSVFQDVLRRPLGFEQEENLLWIRIYNRATARFEERLSRTDFTDLLAEANSFESLGAINASSPAWDRPDRVERLAGLSVSPGLFKTLRIHPVLGRPLSDADATRDAERVVLISHELWQSRFEGDPGVLGQTMQLGEHVRTIVGVLPPGLAFPLGRAPSEGNGSVIKTGVQDVWLPLNMDPGTERARGERMFPVIGRLKPGASIQDVRIELARLAQRWERQFPEHNQGLNFEPVTLREQVLGHTGPGIRIMSAAVVAVLLVCCVNLANWLLARGVVRQREWAVRLALGAGRVRIARSLLVESLLLALLGGGLGLVLALGAVRAISTFGPADVPFLREVSLDTAAALFSFALSLAAALLFGIVPALRQARTEAALALRAGTRSSAGCGITSWQRGLVVGQIAIVFVLVTCAGLLLESFRRILNLDLGYQPGSVITLDLNAHDLPTNEANARVYEELHRQIAAVPGVEAAGVISSLPLTGRWTFTESAQPSGPAIPESERPRLVGTFVAFDYFQAMRIPLLAGRFFRPEEMWSGSKLIIINESAARALYPGLSLPEVVGRRFAVGSNANRPLEIIGVVQDTRDVRLEEKAQPRMYWCWASGGAQFVVRSSLSVSSIIPALRASVESFGRGVILHGIQPLPDIVSGTLAERRFLMLMLAAYAAIALGIAAVGIFGVVAYQVAQRTNEFGVRLALGASPRGLLRLVLFQAGRLALTGLAIGLVISFATNRLLSNQLFGLSPHDPWLLGGVSLLTLSVSLLASALPARRATKVDPMMALRSD